MAVLLFLAMSAFCLAGALWDLVVLGQVSEAVVLRSGVGALFALFSGMLLVSAVKPRKLTDDRQHS